MAQPNVNTRLRPSPEPREGAGPAHLALAEALASIGRSEEAAAAYEAAIRSEADSAPARLGLARLHLAAGRAMEAFQSADGVLRQDMANAQAWRIVAEALDALGEGALAARAFERALQLAPDATDAYVRLGRLYEALDRPFEAAALYTRALERGDASRAAEIEAHVALSGLFGRSRQYAEARRHGEAALAQAPGHRGAHQNLAAVCDEQGLDAEAETHRERAYRAAPLIVTRAARPRRRVLTLASAARANSPDRYLIPAANYDRLLWFIAYAGEARGPGEDYDVVFNAIGDPDAGAALQSQLRAFVSRCGRPVLNAPERIALTARDAAPGLFAGIDDLVVPHTRRVARAADLDSRDRTPFWLLRPPGTHGGEKLEKISRKALGRRLQGRPQYLTPFHDFRSPDGVYRKYRMFFVDRKPYPYHLAAHDHWLVHYQSSLTPQSPAYLEEERRYLEAPEAALGARAYRAIAEIGKRMDLDFAGADFTVLPDGRALLFEANATMYAHPEAPDGPLAHKNPYVERIFAAFQARLESASLPA